MTRLPTHTHPFPLNSTRQTKWAVLATKRVEVWRRYFWRWAEALIAPPDHWVTVSNAYTELKDYNSGKLKLVGRPTRFEEFNMKE